MKHSPFAALFTVVLAITLTGCTQSSTEVADEVSSDQAQSDSAKAAAEAEAAEEAFAQEKNANRGVASVKKKSSKKTPAESIFIVQVGTFKVEENAKKITDKLKSAGLPVFQKKIERDNGTVIYAVRFEPTPNRVEAEKFVSSVKAATGESSLILSVGN